MTEQHGMDYYDATFARDLAWSQKLREQLDELPCTDEDETETS
jgi:hypothetical protein